MGTITFYQDPDTLEMSHANLIVAGSGDLAGGFKYRFGKMDAVEVALAMGGEVASSQEAKAIPINLADLARHGMNKELAAEADAISRGTAPGASEYLMRKRRSNAVGGGDYTTIAAWEAAGLEDTDG